MTQADILAIVSEGAARILEGGRFVTVSGRLLRNEDGEEVFFAQVVYQKEPGIDIGEMDAITDFVWDSLGSTEILPVLEFLADDENAPVAAE